MWFPEPKYITVFPNAPKREMLFLHRKQGEGGRKEEGRRGGGRDRLLNHCISVLKDFLLL